MRRSSSLAEQVKKEIQRRGSPERAGDLRRIFREPIETFGLSAGEGKEIAAMFYPEVKGDLEAALALAGELMETENLDYASVGLRVLERFRRRIGAEHFPVLDRWVNWLGNWAVTDHLSTKFIAETVRDDLGLVDVLVAWTGSVCRWRRRAAAVSLVPLARRGVARGEVFRVAEPLMRDGDDMVQKGVGWLLKEASKVQPLEVRGFLLRWREESAALLLRVASEKLPRGERVLKCGVG